MRDKSWAERVPSQPCVTQNGMETGTREGPQPIVLLKRDTNLKAYVVVWLKSYTFVCLFGECQFRETQEHQPLSMVPAQGGRNQTSGTRTWGHLQGSFPHRSAHKASEFSEGR